MQLYDHQRKVIKSNARFKVIRAGRRSGKTTLEIEKLLFTAMTRSNVNVFYISPTQRQSRSIIWEALKARLQGIGEINESRLEIIVPSSKGGKSRIFVGGFENRENFRGQSAHHITFDETDTMRDFFIGWQEIFRPALIDTSGTADFIGTPKKENPNLLRLERIAEKDPEWEVFHFTSWENPKISRVELEKSREELDKSTYKQEILAEYVENEGALFKYTALLDMFTNTADPSKSNYLVVDVADDGTDKTIFNFFRGLESYRIEMFAQLTTEGIINQIREYAKEDQIPYSNILVDAIGVGAGVASSSLLSGIVGFKSSYQPIRTDVDPVRLPNVHYTKDAPLTTDYRNLRSQCVFTLAYLVNDHKIAVRTEDPRIKEMIIEELSTYQDASKGDGKRFATPKEDVFALIGRSPDISDTFIMRMFFVIRDRMLPNQSERAGEVDRLIKERLDMNQERMAMDSSK